MSRYYGKQPVTEPVVLVPVDTPVDDDNDTPIWPEDEDDEDELLEEEEFKDPEDDS
jgi:hypothetical protein